MNARRSPTIRKGQGDGVVVVVREQESCSHGEAPQEAKLRKRWLTRRCYKTIVGVALKRRGPLESLVHGKRACRVRRGTVGNVLQGNALAVYPTNEWGNAQYTGKGYR
jgi:hypothetical protein